MPTYILWALLGMAAYSCMTLFVKLAERGGNVSTYMVLAVATTIVPIVAPSRKDLERVADMALRAWPD